MEKKRKKMLVVARVRVYRARRRGERRRR